MIVWMQDHSNLAVHLDPTTGEAVARYGVGNDVLARVMVDTSVSVADSVRSVRQWIAINGWFTR